MKLLIRHQNQRPACKNCVVRCSHDKSEVQITWPASTATPSSLASASTATPSSLASASIKIHNGLSSCCWLIQVVPEKRLLSCSVAVMFNVQCDFYFIIFSKIYCRFQWRKISKIGQYVANLKSENSHKNTTFNIHVNNNNNPHLTTSSPGKPR